MTKKQKILDLRKTGLSYSEISLTIPCSKSLVCYYLGDNQLSKNTKRQKSRRKTFHPYIRKMEHFSQYYTKKSSKIVKITNNKQIYLKLYSFQGNSMNTKFTLEDVIQKFGENPKCYLTGQPIDIFNSKSYEFDHIIPRSRGGDDSLDNLAICTRSANRAKHNQTPDEFLNLCKQVVQNHGYKLQSDVDQS